MISILHVVPDIAFGGVEKIVLNYWQSLEGKEFHFDFVTHGAIYKHHVDITNAGSRIFYFQTIGKIGYCKYVRQIIEHIDLAMYDVVHIHIGDITGIYAKAFRACSNTSIICHAHTAHCAGQKRKYINFVLQYLARHYADYKLACGQLAGEYCFGDNNFDILPNAIDTNLFYYDSSKIRINNKKKDLGIDASKKIIGHVGSFLTVKNHAYLVSIFSELTRIRDDCVLLLIGDGPEKKNIIKLCNNLGVTRKVYFLGNRLDVNELMRIFDVFVLPSLCEGFPVVSIEAQASGIPCIFSNTIDKTIDIGAGLSDFYPIDESSTIDWVNRIGQLLDKQYLIDDTYVKICLKAKRLTIASSAQQLASIYKKIAGMNKKGYYDKNTMEQ